MDKTKAKEVAARIKAKANKGASKGSSSPSPSTTRPAAAKTTEPKTAKDPKDLKEPKGFRGLGNIWFDAASNLCWRQQKDKTWMQYNEVQFKRFLKSNGINGKEPKEQTISEVDYLMVRLQHHRRLDFAGQLGGYYPGLHQVCGNKVLITKGPKAITPTNTGFRTLHRLFEELFGDQLEYFYGWIKSALESMESGFPFRPGQLFAVAGAHDCGKSVWQGLVTEILGGRSCKPYKYLIGETQFNGNLFASEHWMIEDEANKRDMESRRTMGAMIKNVVANSVQNLRAMYRDAMSITPFTRITMTLNCKPEDLLVLPPYEADVYEKICLLKAIPITHRGGKPETPETWKRFQERLKREIPGFLAGMKRWKIKSNLASGRYGIKEFHHPELVSALNNLSSEFALLELIDTTEFFNPDESEFVGDANAVKKRLFSRDRQGAARRLLEWVASCGVYLAKLATLKPDRVSIDGTLHNANIYRILKRKTKP